MRARMTILAIETELNRQDPPASLKDNWTFEDEAIDFDPEVLLATIISKAASFCVLYPEPTYFNLMNKYFWARWKSVFENWYKTLALEYAENPIENYNRFEQSHDDIDDNGSSEVGSDSTVTGKISAYDTSSFSNKDQTTDETDTTSTSTNARDVDHEAHIHGNIGVMTTQSMALEQFALAETWGNLYDHIADIFIKEMLVTVY